MKYITLSLKAVSWSDHLKRMVKITNMHKATLGQMGEGINHKDKKDIIKNNEFMNKWGVYGFS